MQPHFVTNTPLRIVTITRWVIISILWTKGALRPLLTPPLCCNRHRLQLLTLPHKFHLFSCIFLTRKTQKKREQFRQFSARILSIFFLTFPERFQQKFVHGSAKFLTSSRRKIFTHTQNIFSHCPPRSFLVLFNRGVGDSLRPVNPFIFFSRRKP